MADAPLPPGTTPGRLGDKVERTAMRFLLRVYNSTIGLVSQRLRAGIDNLLEHIEQVMVEYYGPLLDELLASPDLSPGVRHLLERVRHPTSQVAAMMAVAVASTASTGVISGAINPVTRKIGHWVDTIMRSAIPDPATLAALKWRSAFSDERFMWYLERLGIPRDMITKMEAVARPRLSAGDLFAHQRRFASDAGHMAFMLSALGYTEEDIGKIGDLTKFSPGPADLVAMGVREAWRDDVAAHWGYDADFPAQFAAEMKRLGDEEGWAQRFWRAHWQLPSVTLGLEMLHRQAITPAEFDELLRISDIPAGWRARIEEIAYIPYTRVDTRRMFRFGVLDESEVYQTYRDLGYDHEHAENMSLFTVLDAMEEERSVTKSDIVTAYRLGRMSATEAREALITCGYNEWVADILLANEDNKRANDTANETIGYYKTMYVNSIVDRHYAADKLAAVGLPGEEINRYLATWDLARQAKVKRPTRANMDAFFEQDIVGLAEYRSVLGGLGYNATYVSWYVAAAVAKKAETSAKEAERARKEQEDIEKREVTTAYQRDKALLSVDLAEVATAIAETQVAIGARNDRYDADRAWFETAITVDALRRMAQADVATIQARIDAFSVEIAGMRIEIDTRQTEIIRIRENVLAAAEETQIDALQAEIAALRVDIERIQDTVASQRAVITEERVLISQADVPAEVVSLTEEIDMLSVEIGEAYVLIDAIQTDIAGWMEEVYTTDDPERVDTIRSSILHARLQIEQIQDIVAEHRVAITSAKARLRTLDVPDDVQELISDIDTLTIAIAREQAQIESLQTAIVEHRAQIEQEDRTARDDEILLQITILERQNEEIQDAIRLLERDREETRGDLRRRREKLQRDIANLERVSNLVLLEREYTTDVTEMNRRLGELRVNMMELKEQLAGLTVEYRTGLAG